MAATIADDTDTLENPDPTTTGATAPIVDPSQPVVAPVVASTKTASLDYVSLSTGTNETPPLFGDASILTQSPPPPDSVLLTTSYSLDDSRASQRIPENYLASFQEAIKSTEATLTGIDTDDPAMRRWIDGFQAAIAPLAAAYMAVQEEYDSRATSWYTMTAYFDDYKKAWNFNLTAVKQQCSTLQAKNQRLRDANVKMAADFSTMESK